MPREGQRVSLGRKTDGWGVGGGEVWGLRMRMGAERPLLIYRHSETSCSRLVKQTGWENSFWAYQPHTLQEEEQLQEVCRCVTTATCSLWPLNINVATSRAENTAWSFFACLPSHIPADMFPKLYTNHIPPLLKHVPKLNQMHTCTYLCF